MLLAAAAIAFGQETKPDEEFAIGCLRTISIAQLIYRTNDPDQNGENDHAATLGALIDVHLIAESLRSGESKGYRFVVARGEKAGTWLATATPLQAGARHLAINQGGVVHASAGPFQRHPDCSLAGQGEAIPEKREEDDDEDLMRGPLPRLIEGARKAKLLERFPGSDQYFVFPPESKVWYLKAEVDPVAVFEEAQVRLAYATGDAFVSERVVLAALSGIRQLDCRWGAIVDGETVERGRVRGKVERERLEREGEQGRDEPWNHATLSRGMALFLLPPLHDRLPKELASFPILADGAVLEEPMKLAVEAQPAPRAGASPLEVSVRLTHPKLGTAVVWVSTGEKPGRILAIQPFGCEHVGRTATEEEVDALFAARLPKDKAKGDRAKTIRTNEIAAEYGLKALATAQAMYQIDHGRFAPDIDALRADEKLMADAFVGGVHCGYRYQLSCSKTGGKWMATATPLEPGTTGVASFAINHEEVVRKSDTPFVHRDDCAFEQ